MAKPADLVETTAGRGLPDLVIPRPASQVAGPDTPAPGDDGYRQLLASAPDAVFVLAVDGPDAGHILDANDQAAAMHGFSIEELVGMHIGALDAPEDAAAVPERLQALRRDGHARFQVHHVRRDGSRFPVEVSARLGCIQGRYCAVSFNRDLTEQVRITRQLEHERTRLQAATTAGNVGLWDWDLVTDQVHFSAQWKAQLGYRPHEIQASYAEWESRLHPDDLPAALASVRCHLAGTMPHHEAVFRMKHRDGSWRWIQARGELLRDATGQAVRMVGTHVDVTAHKAAAASLADTERMLRSFYESPGVMRGVVELLPDDVRHICDNTVAGQFFGVDPMAMAGKTCTELGLPRTTIDFWVEQYRTCARERRPISFNYLHESPQGSHHLFCTVTRIDDADGRLLFAYAAFDRSAQARAEADAATLAARMQAIFEADPECIKTVAPDGRLLDMNPAGLRMIGADNLAAIRGRRLLDIVHPDDRAAYLDLHTRVLAGNSGTLPFRMTTLHGAILEMETHSVPLRDPTGRITAALSVTRDVTLARNAERQRDEMVRRVEQLQRLEALGTLSGGIAHDFNNILAAIVGNLQLAMLQPLDGELREHLGEIQQATQRARDLVRQILTFSRRQAPDLQPLDVRPLVGEVSRLLRAAIPAHIGIDVVSTADLPLVHGDPSQLHQVLVNLGTNAFHAMEEHGGLLAFRVDAVQLAADDAERPPDLSPGEYVQITVRDAGIGMDETTQRHLFEPFFTTKPLGKGTGLGLSVAHGLIRNHGGTITVQSRPGHGTTCRVLLPTATQGSQAAAVPAATTASARPAPRTGLHVLLLDDEESLLRSGRQWLERLGYQVTICGDPRQALAWLRSRPGEFHLVVTDQQMPHLTGVEFARQAYASDQHLPIVLCSGFLGSDSQPVRNGTGIRTVLQKPTDPLVLAGVIADLLAQA